MVVSKRQVFGATKVKQNVTVDVGDVAALRASGVLEGEDLACFLVSVHIRLREKVLVPLASEVSALVFSLREDTGLSEASDDSVEVVGLPNDFSF